jgi:hypothetical protein
MGNDFFVPKKHFLPHFFIITVFWWNPGFSDFHPLQGTFFLVFDGIINYTDIKK